MKFIIVIILAALCQPLFSQELRSKKVSSRFYTEIFQVDKKSKQRNGEYLKKKIDTKDTLVTGNYKEDVKKGIWTYFGKQKKDWLSYDYDKKALVQIPESISKVDLFLIGTDGNFALEKVDSPPVYLGYEKEIRHILAQNFRMPGELMVSGFAGTLVSSFIVDRNGKMTGFKVEKNSEKELNTSMLDAFNWIKGEWLPARANGQAVDSKILVIYEITAPGIPDTYESTQNIYVVHISYFGVKRTQVVRQGGGSTVGVPIQHTKLH